MVVFTPETAEEKAFAQSRMGLQSWQWLGKSFAVELRLAVDVVHQLRADGFKVHVEGECPECGKPSPPGYQTCGQSECQQASYRKSMANMKKVRRRSV